MILKWKEDVIDWIKESDFTDWLTLLGILIVLVVLVALIGVIAHQVDMALHAEKIPVEAEVTDKRFYTTTYTTTVNKITQFHIQEHYAVVLKFKDVISEIDNHKLYNKVKIGDKVDCILRILEKKDVIYKDIVLQNE
jgi:Na+-transporting methylmalonyl-CoA/oxaloacetate decarboxylase gamma subunit